MQFILIVSLLVLAPAGQNAPPSASDGGAAYYFLLGRHYESEGRIDEAIAAHKRASALDPASAELVAELAGLYARQNRALDAVETAERALKLDPEHAEANRILGTIYAALGDQRMALRPGDDPAQYAARAIDALEKGRRDGDFDVGLEATLGRLYVQTGAFEKAVPLLQRVVADQPAYLEGALLLAAAQEGAGRLDDAIGTLRNLLEDNPGFYRGQVRLAETYERNQLWSQAAAAYAQAQSLNPRTASLSGRRAAALINAGQAGEARDLLEDLLAGAKAGTQSTVLLYLLAEAQRSLKDLDTAEATARKLLTVAPDDPRGVHVMSLILQDKGDAAAAERLLRSRIARDPLDAIALNSLGYMLAERGDRLDEAVELLQRALKIEPENPSYLDSLGWAYFQRGNFDLADAPLTAAATRLKTNSVVQDHLGDLRFKQDRFDEAAKAWELALAGDGQSIDRAAIEKKIREARARLKGGGN